VNPSYAAVTLRHSPFADARPDAEGRWTVYVPLPIDTQGRGARHLPWPLSTLRAARGVGLGELVGKLGAFGLPAPVFLSAKIGGHRESYPRGSDRCIGAWRTGARHLRPPRICDRSVLASPAERYGKEVAETENKAKKKLVSHTTETSM
jgi:hypothetical protein